eukprot:SAG25_NODE_236_length_11287_cov_246.398999_2_plen_294_part_00
MRRPSASALRDAADGAAAPPVPSTSGGAPPSLAGAKKSLGGTGSPSKYVRVKHKTPSHPFVHPSIPSAPPPLAAGTVRAIGYTEQTVLSAARNVNLRTSIITTGASAKAHLEICLRKSKKKHFFQGNGCQRASSAPRHRSPCRPVPPTGWTRSSPHRGRRTSARSARCSTSRMTCVLRSRWHSSAGATAAAARTLPPTPCDVRGACQPALGCPGACLRGSPVYFEGVARLVCVGSCSAEHGCEWDDATVLPCCGRTGVAVRVELLTPGPTGTTGAGVVRLQFAGVHCPFPRHL